MAATIKDIARLAGVSPSTVSRVLSNQVEFYSEKTAKKVKKAATKLGYRRNVGAVELVTRKSNVIAVIVSSVQTNFSDQIIQGIQDEAAKKSLSVIINYAGGSDAELQRRAIETVIERAVRAILLVAIDLNPQNDDLLTTANIPYLFLSMRFSDRLFPFITSDDFQIGYQGTQYLINKGHRQIGLAATDLESLIGQMRVAGYRKAMTENQLPIDPHWIDDGEFTYEDGARAMRSYAKMAVTAAVASSDLAAIGMLNQAADLKIKVPSDFAIVSVDGTNLCSIVRPKLTSVTQSFYQMGATGLQTLLSPRLKQFKSSYTPIQIDERQSS